MTQILLLIKRIINKIKRNWKHIAFNFRSAYLYLIHKKGTVQDNENRTYTTIIIGKQEWMAENLCVSHFSNGDLIKFIDNDDDWQLAGQQGVPAWSFYKDDPASEKKFGKLYNWHAVNDRRGLAPEGWQIPSDDDWIVMISFLGGEEIAGKKLKSRIGWKNQGDGSNISGFNALPGGYRDPEGWFGNGGFGRWWSSSEASHEKAWRYRLGFNTDNINRFDGPKGYGFSIRCIKKSL